MARKELVANDPMETKLMTISETVNKIGTIIVVGLLAFGVIFGIVASDFISDILRGGGGFISFVVSVIPNVLLSLVVWLVKTLICLWLEYQTEMHCYARVQTEILMNTFTNEV